MSSKMTLTKPFTLDEPTIEEIGERLGHIYRNVELSREPMFAWVQIINDVTRLGEELRRGRDAEAVSQTGDVLTRLLEFLGYHLFVHKPGAKGDFSDLVAETLRLPAYEEYINGRLPEGPSKWIVVKYPFACAKCGRAPCECIIRPWILEDRREKPGPYLNEFRPQADEARKALRSSPLERFTVKKMIEHFRSIYLASYYHQEKWKIGMHLSEELGEATTELGRLEMICRANHKKIRLDRAKVNRAFEISREKLNVETEKISNRQNKQLRKDQIDGELKTLEDQLDKGPWDALQALVGERFKEEIADVMSWLSAIIVKLDPKLTKLKAVPKKFVHKTAGSLKVLKCPWCHKSTCNNQCLVLHDVSGEIIEKASKF